MIGCQLLRATHVSGRASQRIGIQKFAIQHDHSRLAQIRDVTGRIALDERQIGALAYLDRARVLLHADQSGGHEGRRSQRFGRCKSCLRVDFQLAKSALSPEPSVPATIVECPPAAFVSATRSALAQLAR